MADELDVSPSYLNLMERNQRPITVQVLLRLTDVYGIDPRDFMESEGEQSVGEIEQILADPLFREAGVPRAEVRDAAENSPALRRRDGAALPRLCGGAGGDARPGFSPAATATAPSRVLGDSPIDRIRAILQEARNHFPELEDAAETFAADLALAGHDLFLALCEHLARPPRHPGAHPAARGHGRPAALVRSSSPPIDDFGSHGAAGPDVSGGLSAGLQPNSATLLNDDRRAARTRRRVEPQAAARHARQLFRRRADDALRPFPRSGGACRL